MKATVDVLPPLDGVACWEISRIGRHPRLTLPVLEQMASAGAPLIYFKSGWDDRMLIVDFQSPEIEYQVVHDLNEAYQEVHRLKNRTQRPARHKLSNGIWPWAAFRETPFHTVLEAADGDKYLQARTEGAVLFRRIMGHLELTPDWDLLRGVAGLFALQPRQVIDALTSPLIVAQWHPSNREWVVDLPDHVRVASDEAANHLRDLLGVAEASKDRRVRPSAIEHMMEEHGFLPLLLSDRVRILCGCGEEATLRAPSDSHHGFRDRYSCPNGHNVYEPNERAHMAVLQGMTPHCTGCGRRDSMHIMKGQHGVAKWRGNLWQCTFCGDLTARVRTPFPPGAPRIDFGVESHVIWQADSGAQDQQTFLGDG